MIRSLFERAGHSEVRWLAHDVVLFPEQGYCAGPSRHSDINVKTRLARTQAPPDVDEHAALLPAPESIKVPSLMRGDPKQVWLSYDLHHALGKIFSHEFFWTSALNVTCSQ